ncbi:hypothetical protein [uncultured Brevundimonas sp.]|uniref:hypothetical protein n=1 Tax=uncultured Brevundimonas sp. TaxID=213418 RepID=UPI0030ED5FC7|tara:strand:- start:2639 stop:3952 length:1314 start_codon:yes stop_codon:yes gene_type:complete
MFTQLTRAAFAGTVLLAAACTALPGGARIDPSVVPAGSVAFDGLLEADSGPRTEGSTRYIYMVHGMGNTSRDYSKHLFERMVDQGYNRTGGQDWVRAKLSTPLIVESEATQCRGVTAPPCRYESFGEFRTDAFSKGRQRVVVYSYYWHADLDLIQAPFMAADIAEGQDRSLLIRGIKENTIVMGFSDAAAYLGPANRLVREGLAVGLCAMLREAAGRPARTQNGAVACDLTTLTTDDAQRFGQAEFGFVTMSLGSRMLFDTLADHAAASDPVLPALARRTRYFYMLANQLPLLGLGGVQVTEAPTTGPNADGGAGLPSFGPPPRPRGFLAYMADVRGAAGVTSDASGPPPVTDSLDVVAFHDPEDLLGFRAGAGFADLRPSVRFIEVWNRNAPVYLGLVADPRKAHATELEHDTSARLILCGARADANGRLTPLTCR